MRTSGQHLEYQRQHSQQTLRQGLEEYRRANADILADDSDPESAALFRAHDLCHVIFGLDTSLPQEAAADTWTLFGADIRLRDYAAYLKLPAVRDVLAQAGYGRVAWQSVKAAPYLVRVARRARRMTKKWPWRVPEAYMDRTLDSLRTEYGIELLHP